MAGAERGWLHVACATDDAYAPHAAAMIHSALEHGRVHVHLLHGPGLTAEPIAALGAMVTAGGGRITFLEVPDAAIADLPLHDRFPPTMWYRILLPELCSQLDRVLYLDVDTIVVDDLEPLWSTDLAGHYVAAVTNVFQANHLHRPASLGLSGPEVYFNSGVILMNLDLMRRDRCSEALRAYATSGRTELEWPDQDALNVVLGERRVALHPRWNCMNSVLHFPASQDVFGAEALREARLHPGIRHFEGPSINKPWHYLCARDMRDLYWDQRRQTPWPDRRLEGRTIGNFARGLKWRLRPKSRPV
jgi:lipopolysaccharide biosynthesis glycosyltransferase